MPGGSLALLFKPSLAMTFALSVLTLGFVQLGN